MENYNIIYMKDNGKEVYELDKEKTEEINLYVEMGKNISNSLTQKERNYLKKHPEEIRGIIKKALENLK
jgi:hypothetical protein